MVGGGGRGGDEKEDEKNKPHYRFEAIGTH